MMSGKNQQLCLFGDTFISSTKVVLTLSVDGASRGNPGKSGVGIFLQNNKKIVFKNGFYIGIKTNNQAEYLALLIGVIIAKNQMQKIDTLTVQSDSQLLVYQMQGRYKVKNPEIKKLYSALKIELKTIKTVFKHVEREYNTDADALANNGIDKKRVVPEIVINQLKIYELSI